MLRLVLAVFITAGLAAPALAECLTRASLASGLYFTREDGSKGTAISIGQNMVRIDDAVGRADKISRSEALFGIYDTLAVAWQGEPGAVGSAGPTETTFRRTGTPPEPEAGKSWKTRLRSVAVQDTNTTESVVTTRSSYRVTYSFQDRRDVKLSGCTYGMIPVEATFVGKDAHFSYRWAYFPDLGLGLKTRYTDHRNGIDVQRGLTALRLPQ